MTLSRISRPCTYLLDWSKQQDEVTQIRWFTCSRRKSHIHLGNVTDFLSISTIRLQVFSCKLQLPAQVCSTALFPCSYM